jgi:hypothetical protein
MKNSLVTLMARLSTDNQEKTKPSDIWSRFAILPRFFPEAESLRAQFEWRMGISRARGNNLLTESAEAGVFRCLTVAANRVFTQDAITIFLSHLRRWAQKNVRAEHASSPLIQVFSRGCWREPSHDATPATWRYLYVLGPNEKCLPVRVSLLPLLPARSRALLQLSRTVTVDLAFGVLLVHDVKLAYGIEKVSGEFDDPTRSTTFLGGYLW